MDILTMQKDSAHYDISSETIRDLVSVQVLTLRLEELERRNAESLQSNRDRVTKIDLLIEDLYTKINALTERIGDGNQSLAQCRNDLEDKVRRDFVTREQLDLAMIKQGEMLSKILADRFDTFATRMERTSGGLKADIDLIRERVDNNRFDVSRIIYTSAGVGIAATVIYAIASSIIELIGK